MYFVLLLCLSTYVSQGAVAGRIGRFTFLDTEILQTGETLLAKANELETVQQKELSFLGKVQYQNGARIGVEEANGNAGRLSNLLDKFPSINSTSVLDSKYYVQLRFKQTNPEAFRNETSDYFKVKAGSIVGESALQKHVNVIDCVDDGGWQAFDFKISAYAYNYSAQNNVLEQECKNYTYKKRHGWHHNSTVVTTHKTIEEECIDNNALDQQYFRYLQATFVPPTDGPITELTTESVCISRGDERVTFSSTNQSEVFVEQYTLEEECSDNADAVEPTFTYNSEHRWGKSNRNDANSNVSNAIPISVDLSVVPFYQYKTVNSFGTMLHMNTNAETHVFANDENVFSIMVGEHSTMPSREPQFTLTAWLKGHGTVLSILGPTLCSKTAHFFVSANGTPRLDFLCNDNHLSTLQYNVNEWAHVGFTYDGFGTRTVVVNGVEVVDVYDNTTFDFVKEDGLTLTNPHQHNEVLSLQNEIGDFVGSYSGYSMKDCFAATIGRNHTYFSLENGVCTSSNHVAPVTEASVFRRTVQYRITESEFEGLQIGPFSGSIDEVLLFHKRLSKETIFELGRSQNIGIRFDGSSEVTSSKAGKGGSKKVSWQQYASFYEENKQRSECFSKKDKRYLTPIEHHPTFVDTGEGRGNGHNARFEAYTGGAENVSHVASGTLHCHSDLNLDHKLVIHAYQNNTTLNECRSQEANNGLCRNDVGQLEISTRTDCMHTFLPFTNYTWLPDAYEVEYDVVESGCPQTHEIWGTSESLLYGLQGRNTHVYNDHEMTFYYKNKYGGDQAYVNASDLDSMKEWCRGTVSCAGIQQDGARYYPLESIQAPENGTTDYTGFRPCEYEEAPRVRSAKDCYLSAAKTNGPLSLPYIFNDEYRTHAWGYVGVETGTHCSKSVNGTYYWDSIVHGELLCSDSPNDYYTLPIVQTRWQRDNDTLSSTKEVDCIDHRLDWLPHTHEYETRGTASRPHFQLTGQKSWQREPVECLYTTNASFQVNVSTLRECRNEAIFFRANGYSFQREGSEFLYMTARHFTHVEDARQECQRLHAHVDGPEDHWDLCSNQEYDCSIDNTCINSDTPDNTIFAVAACCMNTGTSCALTTDTTICTPKHGYESFSFQNCDDERIENASNTTYNVYAPEWNRSEWRTETRSRAYDDAYYNIVALDHTDMPCRRGLHLTLDECYAQRTNVGSHTWMGTVYDKEKIAGCAIDDLGNMYWNRYTYDSAKQVEMNQNQFCRQPFEFFSAAFDYSNTSCMYLNHELELTFPTVLACQEYASEHQYKAVSFVDQRCLLAHERGPCEANVDWTSFFYVTPTDIQTFVRNENNEHSLQSFSDCVLNQSFVSFKQIPYGMEEHGLLYETSAESFGTIEAAKSACDNNPNCSLVFQPSSGLFYALEKDAKKHEMVPSDSTYTTERHWLKNTPNYHNRTHMRHFIASSKDMCLEACNHDAACAQIMYSKGYCFFFAQVLEVEESKEGLDSFVMYNERKGAVAYNEEAKTCWLYKNTIGQSFLGPDGDCRTFQFADHYYVYPLDERLRGENKIVYLAEAADTSQSTAPTIVTKERSKEWCDNREGSSTWQAYGTVLSTTKKEECTGTWTKHNNIVRNNILQRECERMDSNKVSWTRNADVVQETNDGSLVYLQQYINGYEKELGKACSRDGGRAEYAFEASTLYGEECYEQQLLNTNESCKQYDKGYGYAIRNNDCLIYQHPTESNHSDCRFRHTDIAGTYKPIHYYNFVEAIDACNLLDTCNGICETMMGARQFFLTEYDELDEHTGSSCFDGWSGEDCSVIEPTQHINQRITEKRHTAMAYCDQIGQTLCAEAHVPKTHACVHFKENTNCTVGNYLDVQPVAYCCGKEAFQNKARQEYIVYRRIHELNTCQDPPHERMGSDVFDHKSKLLDAYTVHLIATARCKGASEEFVTDCALACLNNPACEFFTNATFNTTFNTTSNTTSSSCWIHHSCENGFESHNGPYTTYRIRRKTGVYDTPQQLYAHLIGDCKYHYATEEPPIIDHVPFLESKDTIRPRWRCERAFVEHENRNLSWSIHSFNKTFQFDIMETPSLQDTRRVYEALSAFNMTFSTAVSLEKCIEQANTQETVSFNETSFECIRFHNPYYTIKPSYVHVGTSRSSSGYYEGPFQMTIDLFEDTHLITYQPHLPVTDWLLSTAKDECEVLCEQHELCKAYILDQQNCHLHSLPNQTTIEYMRSVSGHGTILVYVRSKAQFLCRYEGAPWDLTAVEETTNPHPIVNTESLATAISLEICRNQFLNDVRVPRLDTFLYNESTGECRISLLRNALVKNNSFEPNGFRHYQLSETSQNPYRTEATKYETEDIARDTCFTYNALLTGRDATSWAAATFWEREDDVIRHEVLESDCAVSLPPQPPKLSYAWDQNIQGSLSFNVKEETCKASSLFLSWRTNIAGKRKIEVNNESECMSFDNNETSATYLGNELLRRADYRSSCNGIVQENNFERIFHSQPIRMTSTIDNRVAVREESIDSCAATASTYYAHFNRSDSSHVFEYHFTKTGSNCAYFKSEECLGLCLPETNPSAEREGFSSYRLDKSLGITAASCWLMSVMDATEGNDYCRKCPIGKFNSRAAANCLPCQQGRYSDEKGLKACKSCPDGTFQFGSGSTHCHHCPKGTYQNEMGERQCKICAAGQYEENGVCTKCPAGKAATNNFPQNNAGELQYTGPSYRGALMFYDPRYDYSSIHGVSYKYEEGYLKGYSPIFTSLRRQQAQSHDSPDDCITCQAGTYSDQTGSTVCKACRTGTYQDQTQQTSCISCSVGTVARTGTIQSFHYFMPNACYSAEMVGEFKDNTNTKTMEDVGFLQEHAKNHIEDCFISCRQTEACLFVSYKNNQCQLFRKCDEVGDTGWETYRLSSSFSSLEDSASLEPSTEIVPFGPPHHECLESPIMVSPETYIHLENHGINAERTIGTALTFDNAISQCNKRIDCVGFTYSGAADVALRTFTDADPIYLKAHSDTFEMNGVQSWFKEMPVKNKEDCQNLCAQDNTCKFMEWNTTLQCRKWSTCTLVKKNDLSAPTSNLYLVQNAASFKVFPFHGRWPCDASVYVGITKSQCEAEAVQKSAPMFYYENNTGACHVYVSYTTNGIQELYSGSIMTESIVCTSGNDKPKFQYTEEGQLYLVGKRLWDVGATSCEYCPAGLHAETTESVMCRQCKTGTYDAYPSSNSACLPCEAGRFQNEAGQSTCKACSAGRYQPQQGKDACLASGQGYRAVGQGFALATQQVIRSKTSGPLQNNSYEDIVHFSTQGATSREMCGRNSFAAEYENINCIQVPTGAISVKRERVWTLQSEECMFDKSSASIYGNVSTKLHVYEGDLYHRNGINNIQECIDFANEKMSGKLSQAIAVTYGNEFCHFFAQTTDGVPPQCISAEGYISATLTIGETQYEQYQQYETDSSGFDPTWFQMWSPHKGVRFISPYQCKLISYFYVGDYFSATDCVNACRQQKNQNQAACRYISYSSSDNKCYFVNWDSTTTVLSDKSGESDKIFKNTLENIEVACSYGSRTVPLDINDQNQQGSGGYRYDTITGTTSEHFSSFQITGEGTTFGETMEIKGRKDKFGLSTLGNGGDQDLPETITVSHESMYSPNLPATTSVPLGGEVTLPIGHYSVGKAHNINIQPYNNKGVLWVDFDIYFVFVNEINCESETFSWDDNGVAADSAYDSYELNLNGQENIKINLASMSTCQISFTSKKVVSNYRCGTTCCDANGYNINALFSALGQITSDKLPTCHKYVSDDGYEFSDSGVGFMGSITKVYPVDINDGAASLANRPRHSITYSCTASSCGVGEWRTDGCLTSSDRAMNGFESECRWSRRRFYDRITTALLQDNTLATNVFPDYNMNNGYQGKNLLETLGFINFVDHNVESGSTSGPLHISYDRITHISYDHDSIMPLFDVGTNEGDFDTTDMSMANYRAMKGANAFEYCTGSTTQRSMPYSPRSCDDLGYPFVVDVEESQSGTQKVCMKVGSSFKCCIGSDCPSSIPLCMNALSDTGLARIPYQISEYLSYDPSVNPDYTVEYTETDTNKGEAYVKDRCSQLGVLCLAVSSNPSNEFYYAHGQQITLKLKQSGDKDLLLKSSDFQEDSLANIKNANKEEDVETIQNCYERCLNTKFCEMFSFEPSSRSCFVQKSVIDITVGSSTNVLFRLGKNNDDNSKAQFCMPCAIGTTANNANLGSTGVCKGCRPGSISSTSDLFIAEEQVGLAGQEQCRSCPAGMLFLAVTHSCIACPKGFICPSTASTIGSNLVQCKEHEYSTSSLLDFSGEDISTTASLRCAVCSSGRYNNHKGSHYCEKCPKGYFSTARSTCQPCPVGTYTLTTASEECFPVDSESFIAWPASTLKDKRLCESSSCPEAQSRTCVATEDAYCQQCPDVRPGHRTYFEGTCKVEKCPFNTYSTAGCLGKDCCIACSSNCKAGQHSVGCGGPDDNGGSLQNTQCADCPVGSYTQYDASEKSMDDGNFNLNSCDRGCDNDGIHKYGEAFQGSNPFSNAKSVNPSYTTAVDLREQNGQCAVDLENKDISKVYCTAAAYSCAPCRADTVSWKYSATWHKIDYNIFGTQYGGMFNPEIITEEFGDQNQQVWGTNSLTGQTYCQSYWHTWNKNAYDTAVAANNANANTMMRSPSSSGSDNT